MIKKIGALVLCATMLSGISAMAQGVEMTQGSRTVTYSGSIKPNTLGIMMMVKSGDAIDNNINLYTLSNAYSNSEGIVEFEFDMPETKNGESSDGAYDVYIKEHNGQMKKITPVYYASLGTRTAFENAVASVSDYISLDNSILKATEYDIVLKAIGCNTDLYTDRTAQIMHPMITDFSIVTWDNFKTAYNTAAAVSVIGSGNAELTQKALSVINPTFGGVAYGDVTDTALIDWTASYLSTPRNTVAEVTTDYELANIFYIVNNSVAERIEGYLSAYASTLGITNETAYTNYLARTDKAQININIAESLSQNPAKSKSDILSILSTAVGGSNPPAGGNPSGGGGGGGTGGGAGGGAADNDNDTSGNITGGIHPTVKVDSPKPSFNDMAGAEWAREAVTELAAAGIVSGDEEGNFRPNDLVKREEFVTMLVLATDKHNERAACNFDDVARGTWYYSYVASAYRAGIVSGVNESNFGTGQYLTRQDMAVLCARAAGELEEIRTAVDFADGDQIAEYAKAAVAKLYAAGAVNGVGDNMFAPLGQATRAQAAQIIYGLFLK